MFVAQSCLTLCDPMDCNPTGSSVHGILRARILKWVAIPFSRGSSQSRDQTRVSCLAGRFFTTWPPEKPIGLINAPLEDSRELPYLFHHVRTWQSELRSLPDTESDSPFILDFSSVRNISLLTRNSICFILKAL